MENKKEKVYIISNIHPSRHHYIDSVCFYLEKYYKVFKPHIDNKYNLDNTKIEFPVFYKDQREMGKANISLVLMPLFGRDCAAEIGYSKGIGNKVVACVERMESEQEKDWLNDWMVKGFLDHIITTDLKAYNLLLENPLLKDKEKFEKQKGKNKFIYFIENKEELPVILKAIKK